MSNTFKEISAFSEAIGGDGVTFKEAQIMKQYIQKYNEITPKPDVNKYNKKANDKWKKLESEKQQNSRGQVKALDKAKNNP